MVLHRAHGAWRLGDTALEVYRREGRWRVRIATLRSGERAWLARNQINRLHFPTRREAVQCLQALLAIDPLPGITAVSRSALRPRDGGRPGYCYHGLRGRYVIERTPEYAQSWTICGPGQYLGARSLSDALFLLAVIEDDFREDPGLGDTLLI